MYRRVKSAVLKEANGILYVCQLVVRFEIKTFASLPLSGSVLSFKATLTLSPPAPPFKSRESVWYADRSLPGLGGGLGVPKVINTAPRFGLADNSCTYDHRCRSSNSFVRWTYSRQGHNLRRVWNQHKQNGVAGDVNIKEIFDVIQIKRGSVWIIIPRRCPEKPSNHMTQVQIAGNWQRIYFPCRCQRNGVWFKAQGRT